MYRTLAGFAFLGILFAAEPMEKPLTEVQTLKFENLALKFNNLQGQLQKLQEEQKQLFESVCKDNGIKLEECKINSDSTKVVQVKKEVEVKK